MVQLPRGFGFGEDARTQWELQIYCRLEQPEEAQPSV